ncbi:MAG TPA: bifunctional lytic transglycosylase/C40 family peptidase [Acidimicrobiales bacterium]|jgi:cell wall-associated NlpC family hydrolase|nr:bifunctional lytic transglycosylase/C40 family peptidase [Acidimicrobiales bacterium]
MGKVVMGLGGLLAATVVGMVLVVIVVMGQGPGLAGGPAGANRATTGTNSGGSPGAGGISPGPAIPPEWLALYQQATATCPGLPWAVLAAIGTVETGSGQSDAPGVWSGANRAGAEGPMQFEPATFAAYATVGPSGASPASPYDPVDAVYSAAALLCANGAGSPATLHAAIADYNHSDVYVDTVLSLALAFGDAPQTSGTVVAELSFAAQQLNTPYLWGGTGNGGFDCSGLAQAAFQHAGIDLPRVAQDQFDAGPSVPGGSPVAPGDLVFFGDGPSAVDHVGLYVGGGEMIDAPDTGELVRFDNADWSGFVGATRPGG